MIGVGVTPPRTLARTRYKDLALSIARSNILALFPLDESSGTTANDRSGASRNGTYSGTVTLNATGLGDDQGVVSVAGSPSGAVNIYTAGLSGAWSGDEYTLDLWVKVSAAGDWTDSTARNCISIGVDGSNSTYIRKATTNNTLTLVRVAAGATLAISFNTGGDLGWLHIAITASKSSDVIRFYVNGTQVGSQVTGLASWSGSPASTLCMIGASSSSRAAPWKGSLALGGIRNTALSTIDVARLARCNGHIIFDGDSRFVGTASPAPEQTMQQTDLKAKRYGFNRLAVSGQTWADMVADISTQGSANYRGYWKNIAIGWAGVNDAVGGADAPTIWSRTQEWASIVRSQGYKVLICSEIDGQNVALNNAGYHSTIWPALNALIRSGYSSIADGLVDLGAISQLQDATNVTYFSDGVHPTVAGNTLIASAIGTAAAAL